MSKRRDILLNVISTLNNIKTVNGYKTDIMLVSEDLKTTSEIKISHFPALFAIDGDEIYSEGNGSDSKLEIIINGVIKGTKNKNERLDNLIEDVEKAMLEDRTRNCLATNTKVLSATTDKGIDQKYGHIEMRFMVQYLHPNNFFFKEEDRLPV